MMNKLLPLLLLIPALALSQANDGTITFSWTAPTTNEDGSPLTDLSGYVVYFGEVSRIGRCGSRPDTKTNDACYPLEVVQPDETQNAVPFTFTIPGTTTYFASAVAYDNAQPVNNLSQWSDEISFTVNVDVAPAPPTNITVTCVFNSPTITCTTN